MIPDWFSPIETTVKTLILETEDESDVPSLT